MPERAKLVALDSTEPVVAERAFLAEEDVPVEDIAVPVGATSFRVMLPLDGFPVTKETVIRCQVLHSQDGGKSWTEGVGITVDGGGIRNVDMETREETFLPYTFCGQFLENPENADRLMRVVFTPEKACRTKVDIQFEGK